MRIEVEMVQEEGGTFRATAVSYPDVSVTGRTEKEALGLRLGQPEPVHQMTAQ